MRNVYKVFFGGNWDDWFSHIVENYEARYRARNPDYHCRYFSWTDGSAAAYVRGIPEGAHITLVGHSYGADAAVEALTTRPVDVLVTIDPGSYFRPFATYIRSMARMWLTVRAEAPWGTWNLSNGVASVGHQYPRPPAAGQPGAPTFPSFRDAITRISAA